EVRGQENEVATQRLSMAELRALEPAITGQAALRIPSTAITDYTGITNALLADVENAGGTVRFNAEVRAVRQLGDSYQAIVGSETLSVGRIIACSGLASDRVARMLGIDPGIRILPFRGEYFVLPSRLNTIVHHLIYPVPDPDLPFLRVPLPPVYNRADTAVTHALLDLA